MDHQRWSEAVAATIRAERAASGLTQEELAEKAGIPRPTYLRYEKGTRKPTLVQIAQIAEALGISISTFTARVEERVVVGKALPDEPESGKSVTPGRDRKTSTRRAVQGRADRRSKEGQHAQQDDQL